ncbi:hypothetical protein C1O66_10740 [Paucibacter aquatile]|uniref:TIGR02646 family protein n=1 Tax=Kinneretia aquatilis TaxID=2070761 RepID=A0A2N8KWW2_9BURK|nr:hypothetical protein [Paucibacter aquatile]PND37957.1 hypothetical protein C1O66_10740 [Paucibacter aquatile]
MIQIQRTRTAADVKGFTGAPLQQKLGKLLQYYYDGGGTVDFKPKARQVWGKAKGQLKKESFSKCAYCEADTAVVAHGDVEHFRPKSGYWWLAYCYDNYTFSCQVCNQSYKGNTFNVLGKKLSAPGLPPVLPTDPVKLAKLVASLCPDPAACTDTQVKGLFSVEKADLVHPYVEDPERYFGWKVIPATEEVWLVPKTSSAQAKRATKAAENVLGLNRTELLRLRWNDYDELETLALALQEGNFSDAKKQNLLNRIRRLAGSDRPFAAMRRHFLRSWGLL